MRHRKKRQLTKAELHAMGVTPDIMARRVGPDGRARCSTPTGGGGKSY